MLRPTLLATMLTLAPLCADAADGDGGRLMERLEQVGKLTCRPAIRQFCRNIHAGCAGRSDINASPFSLTVAGETAGLGFAKGPPADVPSQGAVRIGDDNAYILVWLRPEADYVKVEADGRYSFRLYRRGVAYMSRGTCR